MCTMEPVKHIILIIASLVLVSVEPKKLQHVSKKTTLVLNRSSIRSRIFLDSESIQGINLSYAICSWTKDTVENSSLTMSCEIIMETNTLEGITYRDACMVNIEPSKNHEVDDKLKVTYLSKKKVIVRWLETDFNSVSLGLFNAMLKIAVVEFPSCKIDIIQIVIGIDDPQELAIASNSVNVVPYTDNRFDVIYPNEEYCEKMMCKSTFSADNYTVENTIAWFPKNNYYYYPRVLSISTGSPSKGHVAFSTISDNILLIDDNGIPTRNLSVSDQKKHNFWAFGSAENDLIGFCLNLPDTVSHNCFQFDRFGVQTLNFNLHYGYDAFHPQIYNLPEGGFLIHSTQVKNVLTPRFHLTKIDSRGQRYRTLETGSFECENYYEVKSQIFKKSDVEYCVTLVCKTENFRIDIRCFSNDALSVAF